MSLDSMLLAKSTQYLKFREGLRRRARTYAADRVGQGKANQRARSMLAAAFDAGVSAAVEEVRAEMERDFDIWLAQYGVPSEVKETVKAISDGRLRVVLANAFGPIRPDTDPVRGADDAIGESGGFGEIERETERVSNDHERCRENGVCWMSETQIKSEGPCPVLEKFKVGDYVFWKLQPHFGPGQIKWISELNPLHMRRCKLYYAELDRTEDVWVDDLEVIGRAGM